MAVSPRCEAPVRLQSQELLIEYDPRSDNSQCQSRHILSYTIDMTDDGTPISMLITPIVTRIW